MDRMPIKEVRDTLKATASLAARGKLSVPHYVREPFKVQTQHDKYVYRKGVQDACEYALGMLCGNAETSAVNYPRLKAGASCFVEATTSSVLHRR